MTRELDPRVYILASGHTGSLYVGVTSNLLRRVASIATARSTAILIDTQSNFEAAETMDAAITREKQLKRYRRDWKRNLIERENPAWNDLAPALRLDPMPASPGKEVDPGTRPG